MSTEHIACASMLAPSWRSWWLGALWLVASAAGSYWAMSYDFQPGRMGGARLHWPAESALPRLPHQMAVLAFLHPRCVCSQATVRQLIRTMAAHPGAALIVPIFVPSEAHDPSAWEEAASVRTIRAVLPGARIVFDRGGVEARRFDAPTSGTVVVYARQGEELFRGGITNRRGGEEDNPGLQTVARILTAGGRTAGAATAVFGCPLWGQEPLVRR